MTTGTDHQSIGEVLAALRDEFPDITISKIRFLESQGLIDPERTPSGYRKFREDDVARLRWVLHQQKDNFLPLKVIKARLDDAGPDELPGDLPAEGDAAAGDTGDEAKPKPKPKAKRRASKPRAAKAPAAQSRAKSSRTAKTAASASGRNDPDGSRRPEFEPQVLPLDDATPEELAASASGASLTRKELAAAAEMTEAQIVELEEYGLLSPIAGLGDRAVFSEDALVVANLAADFASHGIGPRHLRMFRSFAEREAGLYDQVIAPRLRRRNPDARAEAKEDLLALAGLGRALRSAFLRESTAGLLRD
jgi:DNA-binding transcriptional MerR regulator